MTRIQSLWPIRSGIFIISFFIGYGAGYLIQKEESPIGIITFFFVFSVSYFILNKLIRDKKYIELPFKIKCQSGYGPDKHCKITKTQCDRCVWVKGEKKIDEVKRQNYHRMHDRGYLWQSCGMTFEHNMPKDKK